MKLAAAGGHEARQNGDDPGGDGAAWQGSNDGVVQTAPEVLDNFASTCIYGSRSIGDDKAWTWGSMTATLGIKRG
jgi:hypothetical protein